MATRNWKDVSEAIATLADGDTFLAHDVSDGDNVKDVLASTIVTYVNANIISGGAATQLLTDNGSGGVDSEANLLYDTNGTLINSTLYHITNNTGKVLVGASGFVSSKWSNIAGIMELVGQNVGASANPTRLTLVQVPNPGTPGPSFQIGSARGTWASPTVVVDGDVCGRFVVDGESGTGMIGLGEIQMVVDGTPSAGEVPGRIEFLTRAPGAFTLALTIDADQVCEFHNDIPFRLTEQSAEPTGIAAGDIYLDDGTNTASTSPGFRRYTGAAWEDLGAVGGSGAVATDAIWDAKGDLAVGTGANTSSKLAVGTNGFVLTADSAEATGTKWAAAGSGDVTKVGTPANDQIGVWTGDGTIEGTSNLTTSSAGDIAATSTNAATIPFVFTSPYGAMHIVRNGQTGIADRGLIVLGGTNAVSTVRELVQFGAKMAVATNAAECGEFKVNVMRTGSIASDLFSIKAFASGTVEAVFNENGNDYQDFRVETDTKSQAFYIDAGAETAKFDIPVTLTAAVTATSATAGLGYGTGAGGAVTQITSRTTGVTLNKVCGSITLVSAAGSATPASFTLTNSAIAATDVIVLNQKSGTDKYNLKVTAVAAGSCVITFHTDGGTTTETPVFNFAVIKAVAA